MNPKRFIFAALLVTLVWSQALANNTYLLPGDAYFYTRLDLESARELADSESPILKYGSHRNGGYGCGYIGYHNLEMTKMSANTKSAIVDAYKQFEKEIKDDPNLLGKMSVFIYSEKYDWKKFGLGLQYNENWVDDSVAFGVSRDHVRLESFVRRPESLMRNWRDSTLVDPLKATLPKLPDGNNQAWTKASVKIDATKCRILIIPNREFDSYLTPANGIELIEISKGKPTHYRRINGEWKPK